MAPKRGAVLEGSPSPSPISVKSFTNNDFLSDLSKHFHLSTRRQELLLRLLVLVLIYVLAFSVRLFSVLRFESVIHEFDPYFNYRVTKVLVEKGFYEFWNWFDHESWYPLGRIVGGTLYPGLMVTAGGLYWLLQKLALAVHIRDVCVLLAPFFAANTAILGYFFGKELRDSSTGLIAAAFLAVCPGYISRSVAGSYDNEGVAIFALLLTFYLFVRATKTGSLAWAVAAAFGYFYMVSAWGGYIFITNLLPIYVLILLVSERYTTRTYVAYCTWYIMGTLLAMQIRFVNFQHVQSGEHMAALGVFLLLQLVQFSIWLRSQFPNPQLFQTLLRLTLTVGLGACAIGAVFGFATGYISPWTGRFYSLLDPTYAKANIPIIASVSEHQPTSWSSFFFDYHLLMLLFPAGMFYLFKDLSDAAIFVIAYALTSLYFAGVMVRLILVATPAVCLVGAVAVSSLLKKYAAMAREPAPEESAAASKPTPSKKASAKAAEAKGLPSQGLIATASLAAIGYFLIAYASHSIWVTSEAYSSPSIVLAARGASGQRIIFDDFREAYSWLHYNTPPDSKVMSWWDYGYQLTAMANRTVIVDNNTWNNTHIATVGRAMASSEEDAYEIMTSLDVNYVLVVFGGVTGYSSDDINKFLWMVRIGGGVYPVVQEKEYLAEGGEYTVGPGASPKMLESLMYKMCYYRYGELQTEYNRPVGYDRARGYEIGNKHFDLEYIEEAFTSSNWIVRIYKVKPPDNRW